MSSAMSNPLLAKTISPGNNFCKKQLHTVIYLSLTLPPQAGDMKLVVPYEVVVMETFTVFECLYCDHVVALVTRCDGFSNLIS